MYKQQPVVYSAIANIVNEVEFEFDEDGNVNIIPIGKCVGTAADEEWSCFQLVEISANFDTIQECKDVIFSTTKKSPMTHKKSIRNRKRFLSNSSLTRYPPLFQTIDLLSSEESIRTEVEFEHTKCLVKFKVLCACVPN